MNFLQNFAAKAGCVKSPLNCHEPKNNSLNTYEPKNTYFFDIPRLAEKIVRA